ncbi:coiled-coil domain-containing protein 39-like [Megalops cyprinoides]|uniref:coiled-coil domain-containing protein 39-like n=1 Tax=Megalops cyprinoides TaxID=118141 RepID=UPI001863CEB1|nr:coiled-coil domain-containing protein 39-like [Megalops cyprinoides]
MANAILSDMGFGEFFSVPLANAENEALENELHMKRKEKITLENKISEHKDAIHAVSNFMKNLKQELSHTRALYSAVEKETESEQHFKILADRERGCLQQEITHLEKELEVLTEKKKALENEILKAGQKMEKLKSQLNWDQQTLDAWLEESAQEDEDTMVLIKYSQQDEARIKELTVNIERTTLEVSQKRKALDMEWTKTMTLQVELDRAAENFRRAHSERQELIRRWENTIEQMCKRDHELEECMLALPLWNQEVRMRQSVISEKMTLLESQESNNQECKRRLIRAEQLADKLRMEFKDKEGYYLQLQQEFDSLKNTVELGATRVEAARSQLTNLTNETKDKRYKVKCIRHQNAALEAKLKRVTEMAISVEERAAEMEQMLNEAEMTNDEEESMMAQKHKLLCRNKMELQELKSQEEDAMAKLFRGQAALSSFNSHHGKLEQECMKKQELLNSNEFQIKLLKKRLLRLKGELQTEQDQVLKEKACELTKTLDERRRARNMLAQQLRKLQVESRGVRKGVEKSRVERRELKTKMMETELFNETLGKELKKLIVKIQDTMVEENLLKLDVKRVRERLQKEMDRIVSLEKERKQMETSMKEKEMEINFNRDLLQAQIRIANQENQSLSAEMNEKLCKLEKMRKKCESITLPVISSEREGGKSLEYYMIQAAQEREELKSKADELDKKVCKKQTEIEALENTLHAIRCKTEQQKASSEVTESMEEYQEQLKLEEQGRTAQELYSYKMRQIRELQQDIEAKNNALDNLHQEESEQKEKSFETQSQIISLNKEVDSQKDKLDRVTKQCTRLSAEIRSAKKTKKKTKEEYDIDLCELRDFNKMVDRMLLEAMDDDSALKPVLQAHFEEKNLQLPVSVFPTASCLSPPHRTARPVRSPSSSCSTSTRTIPRAHSPITRAVKPISRLSSARSSVSSVRSASSQRSGSPKPSPVKTVDLGLQLTVTSALSVKSPREPRAEDATANKSTQTQKP